MIRGSGPKVEPTGVPCQAAGRSLFPPHLLDTSLSASAPSSRPGVPCSVGLPPLLPRFRTRRVRFTTLFTIAGILLTLPGCGESGTRPAEEETISRDRFVDAYVRLREAGLRAPEMEISVQTRDRILEEMQLTQDDLLRFVEVHGDDGALMLSVWEEVDSILRAASEEPGADAEGEEEDPGEEVRPGVGGGRSEPSERTPPRPAGAR